MRLIIEPNYEQLSKWAANYVAAKIKKANPTAEKPFVLGLPTGSSPLGMYKNLIELNQHGDCRAEGDGDHRGVAQRETRALRLARAQVLRAERGDGGEHRRGH